MSTFKKIFKYFENIIIKENNKKISDEKIEEMKIENKKNDEVNDKKIEETKIETDKNDEKYEFTNDPFFFT
jgi:hypothetical protein